LVPRRGIASRREGEHRRMDTPNQRKFSDEALEYLQGCEHVLKKIGEENVKDLEIAEVGDGNLNFIFRAVGKKGSVVIKKAPPFIRLVESWPLPSSRVIRERDYLIAANRAAPRSCPEVYACDEKRCILIMEDLSHMKVWRSEIGKGAPCPARLGSDIGEYLARVHFSTSDFGCPLHERYVDISRFHANIKLVETTVQVFFADPFYEAPLNGWKKRSPGIAKAVEAIQNDPNIKSKAYLLRDRFLNAPQALLHGDLHTGSLFVHSPSSPGSTAAIPGDNPAKVQDKRKGELKEPARLRARMFDAEFAFYGPMGFDLGQLIGNIALGAGAQSLGGTTGTAEAKTRQALAESLLGVIPELWSAYTTTFTTLFRQTTTTAAEGAQSKGGLLGTFPGSKGDYLEDFLQGVWLDARGFASLAIMRRIIGVADAPEMRVKDANARSKVEGVLLRFARGQLLLGASGIKGGVEDFVKGLRTCIAEL